jgi:hypothetical protein
MILEMSVGALPTLHVIISLAPTGTTPGMA